MRPGQQNNSSNKNRQRGRNNNNGGRKHMNPLSRNYESNGPDVKVRGNAAHIAEKYVQLARDAHASGDSVMAENYLQHAEHYFRIVSAAQPQPRNDQFGQPIEPEENDDDFIGDEQSDRFEIPQFHQHQNDRQFDRNQGDRQQNQGSDRQQNQGDRPQRFEQSPRNNEQQRVEPVVADASAESGESQETLAAGDAVMAAGLEAGGETPAEPRRARERRPRRRRPQSEGGVVDPAGPQPEVGELPAFITAGGATNAAE